MFNGNAALKLENFGRDLYSSDNVMPIDSYRDRVAALPDAEQQKKKFFSLLGFKVPKPMRGKELVKYGPKTLGAYIMGKYVWPIVATAVFDRGQQNRPQWKEIGDRIVGDREKLSSQYFREKIEDITPMGWVSYQYGLGTSLDFEFYTAILKDSAGKNIETHVYSRKYGETEPSDAMLADSIRHAVTNRKPLAESQRDVYNTLHQNDFDILALDDRTNGDVEKFIDMPTLRRWTVRDRWHLIGKYPVSNTKQVTVDGQAYTVNVRKTPHKTINGKSAPKWKNGEFWNNLAFTVVYKALDFGYNLIPVENWRSAAKMNFAKEQYKSAAGVYRAFSPSNYINGELDFGWD